MKSTTGNRRILPRDGISSIFYDEFLRHFPDPIFNLRVEENWDITIRSSKGKISEDWDNPIFVPGTYAVVENWELTQYTTRLIHIEPSY